MKISKLAQLISFALVGETGDEIVNTTPGDEPDWGSIFTGEDLPEDMNPDDFLAEPATPEAAPVVAPEVKVEPVTKVEPAAKVEPVVPVEPEVKVEPEAKVEPKAPEAAKPEATPEPTKVEQQPAFDINKYQSELEAQYKLSPEEADLMLTSPETVIPKMAARLQVAILQQVAGFFESFKQELPQVVEQTQVASTQRKTLVDQFTGMWPELAKKENEAVAKQAILATRQAFPELSTDELLEMSGELAYKRLKLPLPTKADANTAPAVVAPKPATAAKPQPFKPATTSSTTQVTAPAKLSEEETFYLNVVQGNIS